MSGESHTTLEQLIKIAKRHVMTPEERREQRISFVYGMLPFNSTQTREDVRRILEEQGYG